MPQEEQAQIFDSILSYLVRRAVCGLTPKNYNNVFLQLLKGFTSENKSAQAFRRALSKLDGAASRWPRDDEFLRAWLTEPAHRRLGDVGRVRLVLAELENGLRTPRSEELFALTPGMLDVDHILPDRWYEHWPLSDGAVVTPSEASAAYLQSLGNASPPPRAAAIMKREQIKQTLGNLTLVHYGVNRSLQHRPLAAKREKFFAESNLHLNRTLMRAEVWNDESIEARGRQLFEVARQIWRGPEPNV